MSFEKFELAAPILRAVAAEGYTEPTPIQAEAIPVVMAGNDVLGCAQTGTGKSAAFALPILHRLIGTGNPTKGSGRKIRVLVLSPTRELAQQIEQSFATYGKETSLKTLVIYGGVSQQKQTRALQHGVDILVATPGRLLDLIQQGYVRLSAVQSFILDEADRMLDMGFMPDIRRIINMLPQERQTLLFSATMPAPIEKLAQEILRNPTQIRLTPERPTTELIEQSVHFISQAKKTSLLTNLLRLPEMARVIVFTRTKYAADRVSRQLNKAGITSDAIHGNKSQNQRQRTLDDFRSDLTQVLVATDVAARGIDIDAITHVINYDLPHEPETYVHRIGRTGRANSTGTAISFCSSAEKNFLRHIERLLKKPVQVAPRIEGFDELQAEVSEESRPRGRQPRERSFERNFEGVPRPQGERRGGERREDRRPKARFAQEGQEARREDRRPKPPVAQEGQEVRREDRREDRRPQSRRPVGKQGGERPARSGNGGGNGKPVLNKYGKAKKKSRWAEIQYQNKPKPRQQREERPALPKVVPQDDRVTVSHFSAPVEATRKPEGSGYPISREEHIQRRLRRRRKPNDKSVNAG